MQSAAVTELVPFSEATIFAVAAIEFRIGPANLRNAVKATENRRRSHHYYRRTVQVES